MLFGCPRENVNRKLRELKVIYIKRFMLYTIIYYEYKTSELKNVEKLVMQTVKALKSCWNGLGMCTTFVQSVKLHSR